MGFDACLATEILTQTADHCLCLIEVWLNISWWIDTQSHIHFIQPMWNALEMPISIIKDLPCICQLLQYSFWEIDRYLQWSKTQAWLTFTHVWVCLSPYIYLSLSRAVIVYIRKTLLRKMDLSEAWLMMYNYYTFPGTVFICSLHRFLNTNGR